MPRALLRHWFASFLWFKLVLFLYLTSCIPGVKDPGVRIRLVQSNNMNAEYSLRPLESSPPRGKGCLYPLVPHDTLGPREVGGPFHSHLGSVPPCWVCLRPQWSGLLKVSALQQVYIDVRDLIPIASAFWMPGSGFTRINLLPSPSNL